ncbi:MAG: ADP-ribosylglycohydrolase family protein [Armatimonadaceae bacterium]
MIAGCLLGTAVGDALGLPAEGLSRTRQKNLFGTMGSYRLLPGIGMVSDDTEHTVMTAQALIASGGEPERFARKLANALRRWILLLPAGVGLATARACGKLLLGFPPDRSGVFSAGNGPAMRSAILGACYPENRAHLYALVRATTRLTHTDPKAEYGAAAVAFAAAQFACGVPDAPNLCTLLRTFLPDDAAPLLVALEAMADSVLRAETTEEFAASQNLSERVSGYVYHTVPVALHAAYRNPDDFRRAVLAAIHCGGDTDTVAAITGGIVGAGVGEEGIPDEWRRGLRDFPLSYARLLSFAAPLALAVSTGQPGSVPRLPLLPTMARNLFFFLIVLLHGMRRLFPPYG